MNDHAFCYREPPTPEFDGGAMRFHEKIITELVDDYDAKCAESIAKALTEAGCTTAFIFDRKWLLDAINEKVERDKAREEGE